MGQLDLIHWHDNTDEDYLYDSYLTNRNEWGNQLQQHNGDPATDTLQWLIFHIEEVSQPLHQLAREYQRRKDAD